MTAMSIRSHRGRLYLTYLLCTASLLGFGSLTASWAQIRTDGSLGPVVNFTGPDIDIGHDVGQIHGHNLFHSFDDFNVASGGRVIFTGPASIDNIVSRVTGGNPSLIDGTLGSDIEGANLFLLNPSGVLFGPNAALDVKGSFHVSTADQLHFSDGNILETGKPIGSGLSIADPTTFGFLSHDPAGIAILGSKLHVRPTEHLTVTGGDLVITGGNLAAPQGRIQLTSVAAPAKIGLTAPLGESLQGTERMGDIVLSDNTAIDTSGEGGGTVVIRAGRLTIDHAVVRAETLGDEPGGTIDVAVTGRVTIIGPESGLSTTTRQENNAPNGGGAGDIHVRAAILEIRDHGLIQARSRGGSGRAGTVRLDVTELALRDGGSLSASARNGSGHAGTIIIAATNRVTISGDDSTVSVSSSGTGHAGRIQLHAPEVVMRDEAEVRARTRRQGNAGTIEVRARHLEFSGGAQIDTSALRGSTGRGGKIAIKADRVMISGADSGVSSTTRGRGDAGEIHIQTGTLALTEGAQISVAALRGSQNASGGTVHIVATDSVLITGDGVAGRLPNDVSSVRRDEGVSATTWGMGNAGTVTIEAPTMIMQGRGLVHARSRNNADGSGDAGTVNIHVARLMLSDRAQISASSQGDGQAGELNVTATESIIITGTGRFDNIDFTGFSVTNRSDQDGGHMRVRTPILVLDQVGRLRGEARQRGAGGTIEVHVDRLLLTGGGTISTTTSGLGNGGTIDITADHSITIIGQNSSITSTTVGRGAGGKIILNTPELILADQGQIRSASTGSGPAGNIDVETDRLRLSGGAQISTEARSADGGDIDITATSTLHVSDSTITASVGGDETTGGNICIDAELVLMQNSAIVAKASGEESRGGRIQIVATGYLSDVNSRVSASSALGIDGTVDIQTLTDLSGNVVPLPQNFVRAQTLLQNQCTVQWREGRVSSFIQRGRTGIPAAPGGFLPGIR